jgi:hypothetical protein
MVFITKLIYIKEKIAACDEDVNRIYTCGRGMIDAAFSLECGDVLNILSLVESF